MSAAASTPSVNQTQDTSSSANKSQQSAEQQNVGADQQDTSSAAPEGGYPEQKHAGAVGLGPEYGKMREAVSRL